MKTTQLKQLIREEVKKQINEASSDVKQVAKDLRFFDAEDMEFLFKSIAVFYLQSKDELQNMDAKGIAKDLMSAYKKIRNRTSN